MIARYNPHKLQKQLKQYEKSDIALPLPLDISLREKTIWAENEFICLSPVHNQDILISADIYSEYGHDVCRLASITHKNKTQTNELILESCHRWVSKLYKLLLTTSKQIFDPKVWIKSIYIAKDYIEIGNPALALTALRKAVKLSPPSYNMLLNERLLVLLAMYPFIPVLSGFFLNEIPAAQINSYSLENIIRSHFNDLLPIRFIINKSGWHWHVFDAKSFNNNAHREFMNIAWLAKVLQNSNFDIVQESKGYRLCLKM